MVSTKAAGRDRFQLPPACHSQSPLLCMPPELRYNIYLEIYPPRVFQPRIHQPLAPPISHGVDHPGCGTSTSVICWDFPNCQRDHFMDWADEPRRAGHHPHRHHDCGCPFKDLASLLRVCQDIYMEAQPVLLRNSTLAFHRYHRLDLLDRNHIRPLFPPREALSTQLKAFHQNHLHSSLSGLDPTTSLRRLRLAIYRFDCDNVAALKFISRHNWKLDSLEIKWQHCHQGCDFVPWFLDNKCLQAVSRLCGVVKQMTFSWPVGSLALPDSEHNQHEPAADSESAGGGRVGVAEYEAIVTRVLMELAARPRERRTQAGRRRSVEHGKTEAIFLARLRSRGPEVVVADAPNVMTCTISFSPASGDGARVGRLQTVLSY